MKPFKDLKEQINILKSRNMLFKDELLAEEYLLYNNYYNIINCYSKFFLDPNGKYMIGTDFEDIIHVHHFDKEVKSTLFKYTIESEKTFKSVFAFRYSEYYKNIPYSYLDINHYDKRKTLDAAKFISQLSNIISVKNKEGNNSISHYIRNHQDVPMWVLINNMTFGQVSKLYSYMDGKLKNLIAKDLSKFLKGNTGKSSALLSPEELESYLFNMVELRNVIAHNNKLLGYKCRKHNKHNSYLHSGYNISGTDPRNDIFNVFVSMKCFLTNEEFIQANNSLYKRISKLNKKIDPAAATKIFNELGINGKLVRINLPVS